MPKFRVYANYTVSLYADVEAEDSQEAYELARDMDGSEFTEWDAGDWHIESDPDLLEEDSE